MEELSALAERNHRNINDLKAEVRLLDGTRHAGAKIALEESRDSVLAQLLAHDEQQTPQKGFVLLCVLTAAVFLSTRLPDVRRSTYIVLHFGMVATGRG